MPHFLRRSLAPLFLFAAAVAFAQVPTLSVVDTTTLNSTLGNAGKGVIEAQTAGFTGVAFGNNVFVAVATSSRESVIRWATSPDGVTWTARSQAVTAGGTTGGSSKVHFINGEFMFFVTVAVGGNFGDTWFYHSADGLNWTGLKAVDGNVGVVEFGGEGTKLVATGTNGNQIGTNDLTTWNSRPVVANPSGFSSNDLAYGNGRFISTNNGFGGSAYTSADTTTWTAIPALGTPGGPRIEFGNGIFIGTAGNVQFRSTDGVNFTRLTTTAPTGWIAPGGSPTYTSLGFIAAGTDLATGKTGYVISPDGQNWGAVAYTVVPAIPAGQFSRLYLVTDLVVGNGKLILAGQDIIQSLSTKTVQPFILSLDATLIPPVPVAPVAPTITTQPVATAAVLGRSATFSVAAAGSANTYVWHKDTTTVPGATAATYTITSVTAASAGNYFVVITNSVGTITSATVALTLVPAAQAGRLINLSVRTSIETASDEFTLGYVVGGSGTSGAKPLVIRAAGPSLGAFGIAGTLNDPKLETFAGSTKTGENDNWGGGTQLTADLAAVGAFAFSGPASRDAAVSTSIASRDNSVKVTGVSGATGEVIAEVYDATPSPSFGAATPRLLNVSVRKSLGTGLTAGFVLGGTTPTRVLIRVVGPGLAAFGVGGTVADPQLTLFSGSAKIGENNDWGGSADLVAASNSVGAFALPAATSKDAVLLVSLPPGQYSVQASGVANTTGVAIVEVYEVP